VGEVFGSVEITENLRVRGIEIPQTIPPPSPTPDLFFVTNAGPVPTSTGQPITSFGTLGNASSTGTSDIVGLVLVGAGPTLPMLVQSGGVVTLAGLVAGARYFLDLVDGGITTTAPSLTGQTVVALGYALADGVSFVIEIAQPILL
jgi:hypothetical protein